MYHMVTDGNMSKVHYYSGPDAVSVPRAKQLLGPDWYSEEFSKRNLGQATPLWNALMPQPQAKE